MKFFKFSNLFLAGVFLLASSTLLYAKELKPYESKAAGLKAQVPAKWERRDNINGFLSMFIPPAEKGQDPYANYMGFFVHKLNAPMTTMEAYTEFSEKEVKADPNAALLESDTTVLSGLSGHRMTGTTGPVKWTQVWTVKNEIAYVCTYVAQKASYPKFVKDFENMVSSVAIA